MWVDVGLYDHFLASCGWVLVIVIFFLAGCWSVCLSVTFFLAGCELVWPFSGWVWVGVRNCDLFLAGCGWVWVSVRFITSHPLSY